MKLKYAARNLSCSITGQWGFEKIGFRCLTWRSQFDPGKKKKKKSVKKSFVFVSWKKHGESPK